MLRLFWWKCSLSFSGGFFCAGSWHLHIPTETGGFVLVCSSLCGGCNGLFSIMSVWSFYKMGCQTRELEQMPKNMTWTCLLQLLSQGNSASTYQDSFLRCFISYFIGLKHWAKAIGGHLPGFVLCFSALTITNTIQVRSSLFVLRSYKSRRTGIVTTPRLGAQWTQRCWWRGRAVAAAWGRCTWFLLALLAALARYSPTLG